MDMWKAGDEVMASVKDLIAKYHPHLAMHDDEIVILFKDKASKVGDKVIYGKTAKASPVLALLADRPYKFIITLGADEWQRLSDAKRLALLDHHLCGCAAEENKQTGDSKFWLAPPDVAFYQEEVKRHGFWRTTGGTADKNVLEELFGIDEEEA